MAIAADLVPIERPCPVDLDPALSDGSRRAWHCGHCDQKVHVLSSMTEDEARSFMAANDGKKICVTYLERADGTILFRKPPPPPLVPVSALSSRRLALGLGLTAALAACTPTERAEPTPAPVVQVQTDAKAEPESEPCKLAEPDDTKMSDLVQKYKADVERDKALAKVEPEVVPEPEPEPEVAPEVLIPRPGGIMARPLPRSPPTPPVTMKRGGIGG